MKLTETIKTAIIAMGLSTATVSATEQVKEKCELLKINICEEGSGENITCKETYLNITNGKFTIGKYSIEELPNGNAVISDIGDINGSDIAGELIIKNKGNGKCELI